MRHYTYDDAGQLTGATGSVSESYAYDEAGNRTSATGQPVVATELANRLTDYGYYTYEYDEEGNVTKRTLKSDPTKTTVYTWNHRNQLSTVKELNGTAVTQEIRYVYDASGRRWRRQIDADGGPTFVPVNEYYVYSGAIPTPPSGTIGWSDSGQAELSMRFGHTGQLTHRYQYGPAVDQALVDESFMTFGGQTVTDDVLWLLADHQNTVRDIVDSNGTLRKHVDYDSFGNITGEDYYTKSGAPTYATHAEAVDQAFGHTGLLRDAATELLFADHRVYDPSTGRWLSEDPSGFDGGDSNLYRFVGNSPLNQTDPTGLQQAGNPLDALFGGYSGNKVSPYKPIPSANLAAGTSTTRATSIPSGPTSRADYFQRRIAEETRQGNLLEVDYLHQQMAFEGASRSGGHPDQLLYESHNRQLERNFGTVQRALEYPQRKLLGALGTSPEELAAAAAYARGDAYVPANYLVEVAPGVYQQPQVYAPELHPNYSKYRLGTGILSDPLTYGPGVVAAAVNRGRAVKAFLTSGDTLIDAVRGGQVYEVGLASNLRKTPFPGTQVHHVPQSREAELLIGAYSQTNRAGKEVGIRLPISEHEAVSAAQAARRAPASARDLLADEIWVLRNNTGASNSQLRQVIQINRDTHFDDFRPLHRTRTP